MTVKTLLLAALGVVTLGFVLVWVRHLRSGVGSRSADEAPAPPTLFQLIVGFGTNFFDTLGIGSYAPTTAIFKLRGMVPDERIPGTLSVGHTLATITQAFIFMTLVEVDGITLALMIGTAVAGAYLGAGIVSRWPRRNVQIGMGVALLAAATLFTMNNLKIFPGGGDALALSSTRLGVGMAGNFLLGSLMTIGIGLYAPCMILVSLLGMNPQAAFPIMMGSCAFLMPVASVKFLEARSYSVRPALGLVLGGIPAVLIAAFIVKSLPLTMVRWLVVVVVTYSSIMMLRSAYRERAR
ncbi:MAG TPA: sulfite exporter TauE/SafE family protein [Gemmatimonadales bacterium]